MKRKNEFKQERKPKTDKRERSQRSGFSFSPILSCYSSFGPSRLTLNVFDNPNTSSRSAFRNDGRPNHNHTCRYRKESRRRRRRQRANESIKKIFGCIGGDSNFPTACI